MKEIRTRITETDKIIIPPEFRQELNLQVGDEVVIRLEDGELRVFTMRQTLKRAQDLVGRYISSDRSLAEELLADRHQERDL